MHWLLRGVAGFGLLAISMIGCSRLSGSPQQTFVTQFGLGPDKWATAWLLTRHAVPGAKLVVVGANDPIPSGIAFDVSGTKLQRVGNRSTFEAARDAYNLHDPDLIRLSKVVHDIEVNFWAPSQVTESAVVERAFRTLQRGQTQGTVTPECYVTFFDSVYQAIRAQRTEAKAISIDDLAVTCDARAADSSAHALVPEIEIPHLLDEMKRGKSVVFVDVREASEFDEAHIPGAINVTLRDLGTDAIGRVKDADYVISYCVKDFRGFEMAKALRQAGVRNAAILKPYGMKGWLSHGLPLAGTEALAKAEAMAEMARCIESNANCLQAAKHY